MQFVATERAKQGTGASRRLRLSGKTPGIVYGAGEAQLIEIDHNALWHAVHKEAFHSSILDMEINGQVTKVVLRDVQFHPYKKLVQHIDFQRVDGNTKLHMNVPLHFEGTAESPAVKVENCTVTPLMHELQVICEPANLPEFIKVDLSALTSKSVLGLQALKLPNGVKAVVRGANKNPSLISIKLPEVAPAEGAAPAPAAAPAKKGKK
ncbi:UNVERIFIED_CONTAM: 50S ribosomal protein L25/general stress protein Ctc [Comamonas sp. A-3]|mgnify:FL=1|uniref:Large ribosomal subunit protein bL25 n=1 Tax=Comamonas thiooxydans TaxID=363952 RepID=A0AA42PXZ7_9BURK|nr:MULTISPECIES: 50S ribosomal protein L25/general stress protein Ctc [Comamonas]ACY31559.1 ribosomal 5S rRNA E-loop binding protein [Comamonas thiooxydans]MBL5977224.1 50S ribosomal protein L25/general stress protein Ctc [Comamonas sp. NyZ500]MDH1333727.1 50S ribosomal protein L25/general stress protein Ctc [Comamonas thiooxydans]MDH1739201.1 50S ribosomal protein L25/general stress protein Ctc [Comamonas thiooxydans]MDH1785640.1 50S ribosomal protein L25/general stress protein Ctc [Comamonas